jgi:hypothetical protein
LQDNQLAAHYPPRIEKMVADRQRDNRLIWLGGAGLLGLLVVALTYATVESGTWYQPAQINQVVQEQDPLQPDFMPIISGK